MVRKRRGRDRGHAGVVERGKSNGDGDGDGGRSAEVKHFGSAESTCWWWSGDLGCGCSW